MFLIIVQRLETLCLPEAIRHFSAKSFELIGVLPSCWDESAVLILWSAVIDPRIIAVQSVKRAIAQLGVLRVVVREFRQWEERYPVILLVIRVRTKVLTAPAFDFGALFGRPSGGGKQCSVLVEFVGSSRELPRNSR